MKFCLLVRTNDTWVKVGNKKSLDATIMARQAIVDKGVVSTNIYVAKADLADNSLNNLNSNKGV